MQRYFAINKELDLLDSDKHHIINVMRMKKGEKFILIYNNYINECIIEDINKKDLKYTIISTKKSVKQKKYKLVLALSLIKEQKLNYALQKACELDVDDIILLNTKRTIINIKENDKIKKIERYNKILKEACEQSHRTDLLKINSIININELNSYKESLNLILTVNESSKNIKAILKENEKYDKILVVIGPEGGFEKNEEKELINNGFISTSLGENVLRSETSVAYIASVINFNFMR